MVELVKALGLLLAGIYLLTFGAWGLKLAWRIARASADEWEAIGGRVNGARRNGDAGRR